LFLNDTEHARGALHPRQIAIQSTGAAAALPYKNKEWGPERFVMVAEALGRDFHLVQLGAQNDPALPVQTDLRGKTSLREAAAILSNSLVFVGLEGFLTHLARAVDCRSVVVMGGRARPEVFGYTANLNLFSPEDCAPCGLRNTCPHELRCMSAITQAAVLAAVEAALSLNGTPLPVETIDLP
jgi:ADP-heptose:LPS heptosyltransferase